MKTKPSTFLKATFSSELHILILGAQDGKAATGEMDREHGMDYSDNGGDNLTLFYGEKKPPYFKQGGGGIYHTSIGRSNIVVLL